MKFLFDENCSPSDKFIETHPICENVKYRLEQGVKDEAILEHVSKDEFIIVTKDIRFALDATGKKFKVIYHHESRNKDYFLQAGEFEPELVSEFKSFEFK
ncbi:MAG: DUF5615 family PIN-like protein [Nitrosopumilus sp.]|nr:DUF5615 family PIN-like protein [Nitrosopumilus sp.]